MLGSGDMTTHHWEGHSLKRQKKITHTKKQDGDEKVNCTLRFKPDFVIVL